jgi:hypothetical protein
MGELDRSHLTHEEAEEVLRRAVLIDESKRDVLTMHELRSIATELGISHAALDEALVSSSTVVQPTAVPAPERSFLFRTMEPLAMFSIGALVVAAAELTSTTSPRWLLAVYAALLIYGLEMRGSNRFSRLVKGAVAAWAGLLVGVMAVSPHELRDAPVVVIHLTVSMVAALGGMILRDILARKSLAPPAQGASGTGSGGSAGGSHRESLWLRTLRKLSRWMDPVKRMIVRLVLTAAH